MFAIALLVLAFAGFLFPASRAYAQAAKSAFSDWSVVVVAGDWHAHDGGETDAFDNVRRDVSAELATVGFARSNIHQYSLRPRRPKDDPAVYVGPRDVVQGMMDASQKAPAGCLFYVSAHGVLDDGVVQGAVFGPGQILHPIDLKVMLDSACPGRPTVVVVSACFSGVFLPTIESPDRLVMTASRADRSSFGCGDQDRYPYFDACLIQTLPQARDFVALARKTKDCVDKRESDEGIETPSMPQFWMGTEAQENLPFLLFSHTKSGP
jgi:hypothetical protein